MAESVSAANEVKLTEAEVTALSEAVNLGLSRDSRIARDGVISRHVESLLGARLSAREPDNEAVRAAIAHVEMQPGATFTQEQVLGTLRALAAVPVSGVPTEAVRELADELRELHRPIGGGVCSSCYTNGEQDDWVAAPYPCPTIALVQRAVETNESGTP